VTTREQPIFKAYIGSGGMGKSIFPTFNVNVPMPSGTAEPATVNIPQPITSPAPADTTPAPAPRSDR
jgi:hypothetical protein